MCSTFSPYPYITIGGRSFRIRSRKALCGSRLHLQLFPQVPRLAVYSVQNFPHRSVPLMIRPWRHPLAILLLLRLPSLVVVRFLHSSSYVSLIHFALVLPELAFQRIEAQHSLLLSRQIGTPNITSKGKLQPRSVLVPAPLYANTTPTSKHAGVPLIEELPLSGPPSSAPRSQPPKGILKSGSKTSQAATQPNPTTTATANLPELSWSSTDDGHLRIALSVPHLVRPNFHFSLFISQLRLTTCPGCLDVLGRPVQRPVSQIPSPHYPRIPCTLLGPIWPLLTSPPHPPRGAIPQSGRTHLGVLQARASIPDSTLDLEPRRLIFIAPDPTPYALDLDLSQPDVAIQRLFGDANKGDSALFAMRLKRERPLDVDGARAEWHVAEGQLIVYA